MLHKDTYKLERDLDKYVLGHIYGENGATCWIYLHFWKRKFFCRLLPVAFGVIREGVHCNIRQKLVFIGNGFRIRYPLT